ncbi:MAG: DUF3352 domain-containing protein [Verrucomicrobiaceae bacterium]|nr:DUF3352 domain-containing protein [Verrucomicrobiaceae bacterium]
MIKTSSLFLTALLGLCVSAKSADRLQEWSRHLPENTVAVIQIKNMSEVVKDWEKSSINQFINDPDVKKWLAPALEGESIADKFKKETGSNFTDAVASTPGAALIAFVVDLKKATKAEPKPELVVFADLPEGADKFNAVQAKQLEAYKKGKHPDAVIIQEELAGQQVSAIASSGEKNAKWLDCWAVIDNTLVEAYDRSSMESALNDMKSSRPSALEKKITRQLEIGGKQSDVMLMIDLEPLIQLAEKAMTESMASGKSPLPVDPQAVLSALGLKELQGIGAAIDLEENQSTSDFALLYNEGANGLIQALFKGTSTEVALPAFVPKGVDGATVTRQSLGNIWQALMDGIQKLGPMAAMALAPIAATEQQVGMTLKDDLFGTMDDTFVEIQSFGPPKGPLPNISKVTMIKLKDQQRFNAALEAIKKLIGNGFAMFEETEFEGHKIFAIKSSLTPDSPAAGGGSLFSYVVANDYVLFSQGEADLLHKVLLRLKNADGEGAWDDTEVQAAISGLPKDYHGVTFSKGGSIVKLLMTTMAQLQELGKTKGSKDTASKGPKGPKAGAKAPVNPAEMNWFDPSATPPDEVFSRYFGTGASALYTLPDAFQVRALMMPPAAK